ncbi:hypothetical protein Agabi119p4_4768 [Agaricus bisporus var. burnettii]|uniref:F-box domain-containing protein n=1 Tax=Agaricus bisporus var. burnettii TaxID=192524 RepID=A0A8H7F3U4_AGABI|nr:hypothetical protein Agabi119p4_4768 [Agaricus bisporus var. burnettii]
MALPLELLDNVFATLAPADLLVLARTSPAFFPIAQRHLYRSISLGPSTKNPLVVVLLARNPHLARCVRSFHVRMEPRSPIFSSFYTALAKALVNMTGLESLELSLTTCSSSVLRAAISDPTVSYPRLRHFSSSIPFDSTVVDFLSKAPILDSLSLDHIPDPKSPPLTPLVPPSILPALSQFTGPLHAALAIVPSRPLASVQLHDGDLTEEIVETLAASSQNLLNFSASTSSPPLPILRSISRSMSNLVYLRLMNTQNFLDVPDRTFFLQVAEVLYDILELSAFELCGMYWNSSKRKISETEERRIWTTPYEISFPSHADYTEFDDAHSLFPY